MGMMPWADDKRCLYCDAKLPLYRKLTQGQFCSKAHQAAYWQEQERLAIERLHQTHDALQAYRPAESIEAILGPLPLPAFPQTSSFSSALEVETEPAGSPPPASEPAIPAQGGLIPQYAPVSRQELPGLVAADPVEYEFSVQPLTPRRSGGVIEAGWQASAGAVPCWHGVTACGPALAIPKPAGPASAQLAPVPPEHAIEFACSPALTGAVSLPAPEFSPAISAAPVRGALGWLNRILAPVLGLGLDVRPRNEALEDILFEQLRLAHRLRLPAFAASGAAHALFRILHPHLAPFAGVIARPGLPSPRFRLWAPAPAGLATLSAAARPSAPAPSALPGQPHMEPAASASAQLPVQIAPTGQQCAPAVAGLQSLTLTGSPAPSQVAAAAAQPLERHLAAALPVLEETARTAEFSYPVMAGLRPLAVAPKASASRPALAAEPEAASTGAPPEAPSLKPAAALALRAQATKLLRLVYRDRMQPVSAVAPRRPLNAAISHGPNSEPILPESRLEPLADKPLADLFRAHRRGPLYPLLHPSAMLAPALDFWRNSPRDLKVLLFAIPLLLTLAFHPALPKVSVKVPDTSAGFADGLKQAVHAQLASLRQSMLDRAAIALDEDFRQGLDAWTSPGGATAEWSFDETGFVQPGPLALYAPSMRLTNYQMQFLGMIDEGALSWVVRAADFQNYYVIRLVRLRSGPIPAIGLQRYAVINGKAQDRVDTPVPISARDQMQFRVQLNVNGDDFALQVQGQMADVWTEKRLKRGGIGFFTLRGERSRVRWVQLTHQYDVLGRLCAYLAPYDLTTTLGSW